MKVPTFFMLVFVLAMIVYSLPLSAAGVEITPEMLIHRHVESIGSPDILRAVQSRVFVGPSAVEFVQGMNGSMRGVSMYISEGDKSSIIMRFRDLNYPGEYLAFDGKEVSVGHMTPGQKSPLADFLFRFNGLFKEGLLGGVLSVSWPLTGMAGKHQELSCKAVKSGGQELYQMEYRPKEGLKDMKIRLYFDRATYRHLKTEYTVQPHEDWSVQNGAYGIMDSIPQTHYLLIERFDDFREVSGMMLPHSYSIEYSLDGQGHSFVGQWHLKADRWVINRTYDPLIFKAQK